MATHPIQSVSNENKPLLSCSPSLDPFLAIGSVTPIMGVLDPSLPPIDQSEYSFQDVVRPSYEDLLEAMSSLEIPLDDVAMVLSSDHIIGLDYLATKPKPNFPSEPDITISRSSDDGINEPFDFVIELQIGVPYEFDVSHRWSDSPNNEFLLVDSIIGVDFGLPIKYVRPMHRSTNFGVDES